MRINYEALKKKVWFIDAPVSGCSFDARNGNLVTMAGGDTDTL